MRALIQRVRQASVTVDGQVIGEIGAGMLILVCAMDGDSSAQVEKLARKIPKMRIFTDENDKMNLSLLDTGGQALIVSQFTLAADTSRGNRPGFSTAARPEVGKALYEEFIAAMSAQGITVATGEFGADMQVALINDGPVTIWTEVE
ncbi:D-aminoacyl-tRNA deacylase [Rhodovulum sp. FJ3]|uniref:D-aminoacyl-tRNA deacylase n=1 Tax=Rhodovulum sp. FJ3 TaxID=3079053 RepID=UPI00293DFEC2|nr:D-aminoacyl-tRNA deacylase [Rhodovulum sp. FJ3]MDV4168450.1 D-aminoacyl-tRNA deacylase [Rhodovulum sp. FJ3]